MANLAVTLKRWFKDNYGLAVRVRTVPSTRANPWVQVSIPGMYHGQPGPGGIPPYLGRACMAITYPLSPALSVQSYGGNISTNGITMHEKQWLALLAGPVPTAPADVAL